MNRTLKLAFGALLGSMLIIPALAQENFPDIPENHWVFQALLNMKQEGILVGYPDGLFRGQRPASRYELAGAINAAYQKLKGMMGGLQSQIDALKEAGPGGISKAELDALRADLERLKSDMDAMRKYGDDIAALQRMATQFEKDLAGLGVDVEAMKKDLSDLAARVAILERHKPAVDIHGDVNAGLHGGHSTDGLYGLTVDARPTGVGRGAYATTPVGMDRDLSVGHEAGFQLSGTNETGPKWHGTVVIGNLMGFNTAGADGISAFENTMYGNQSGVAANLAFHEQVENVYFQDFGVTFDTSLMGQGFSAELGRFGHKSGNYFYQRIDNTPYFDNPRWDDGNWYGDGADLGFHWGQVGLNVFASRNSSRLDSGEFSGSSGFFNEIWPLSAGPQNFFAAGALSIDRVLGFDLNFRLGQSGDVMLHYIFLDSDNPMIDPVGGVTAYNRVNVWGGEVNFNIGQSLWINGGYSQSDLMDNSSRVLSDDNFAWWAQAKFNVSKVGIGVGYRHIEPWFGAPGDWGRNGFLWNPVDQKGPYADVTFNINNNVNAKISAYDYEPVDMIFMPSGSRFIGISAMVGFKVAGTWDLDLGWEYAQYKDIDIAGNDPNVNWYRLGLHHNMADGSMLKFMYEMSRYNDEGSGFTGAFGLFPGDRRGGLFTTQWMRKF